MKFFLAGWVSRNVDSLVFILLFLLSFYLVVNYNQGQRAIFLNTQNVYSGKIEASISEKKSYFDLANKNEALAIKYAQIEKENLRLKEIIAAQELVEIDSQNVVQDVEVTNHRVVSRNLNSRHNKLVISNESAAKVGSGVTYFGRVLGIVSATNKKFATVLPIINPKSRIQVEVKDKQYQGLLVWSGTEHHKHRIINIPKYAEISEGDTIITSGNSLVFPRGVLVGVISRLNGNTNGNLNIEVDINLPYKKMSFVQVLDNKDKAYFTKLSE